MSVIADRYESAEAADRLDGRARLAAQRVEAGEQRRLAARLGNALQEGAFQLQFQPRIALETGLVAGAEARLGLPHRRRGMIPLDETVKSLAGPARLALMEQISEFLLNQACVTAAEWPPGWSVAVNIAARCAGTRQFAQAVEKALSASKLTPQRLDLEIAEADLVEAGITVRDGLAALRALGVGIILDEFGHAYASLALLRRLPLAGLKLDRSLTRSLDASAEDRALLRATVEIGHGLGLRIAAEGVETGAQLDLLRRAGCDEAQGPWLGPPMPPGDMRMQRSS
ncbi:MAG TPA: EAL domain-containing protein [Acetobacteraceae bacterium]|nr:EAL domain-containing protein [Acetobacteraceae bacterium]